MQTKFVTSLLFSTVLPWLATAAPTYTPFQADVVIGNITADQVRQFAPGTAGCPVSTLECTSCQDTADGLNEAFSAYNFMTLGQKAGMIAYMEFESVDFTYNTNQFPGRPGQGTKCMLMPPHLYNFVNSFPELQPQLQSLSPYAAKDGVNWGNYDALFPDDNTRNQIRALVLPNKYTFKCATWFMTSYPAATCDKTALNYGLDGWVKTMQSPCFGVEVTADRTAKYCSAMKVLAPSGMSPPPNCSY